MMIPKINGVLVMTNTSFSPSRREISPTESATGGQKWSTKVPPRKRWWTDLMILFDFFLFGIGHIAKGEPKRRYRSGLFTRFTSKLAYVSMALILLVHALVRFGPIHMVFNIFNIIYAKYTTQIYIL